RVTSAPAGDATPHVVRLTLSPTDVRDEPERAPNTGTIALTGLTVTRPVAAAPQRADTRERLVPLGRVPRSQPEAFAAEAPPRGGAVALAEGSVVGGGAPAPGEGTIALPPAVFRGAQARMGARALVGVRRR
ncbi:MAG TPA: hypothetical protein VH137_09925, partial [Gemmatimonadales bacterium]|nr:hypothetical protein [Gemmatimonadales bacterium]